MFKTSLQQRRQQKEYAKTKRGHLARYLGHAKERSKFKKLQFNITLEYLESIATDECPIFKTPFKWGRYNGKRNPQTPSLDRIIPALGYVKGNVVFISDKANRIKQEFDENDLYAVADWLHDKRKEILNALASEPTPVPAGSYIAGAVGNELGSVSTPWTWEDSNNPDDHSGTDEGHNADRSTKESS